MENQFVSGAVFAGIVLLVLYEIWFVSRFKKA
jgi:hypothetical protein